MDAVTPAQELRRKTNPIFNDRKLKLGTFGTNLDRGCAISTIDGVLEINWPNTLELAKTSEAMEFEALVPIGRWHGVPSRPRARTIPACPWKHARCCGATSLTQCARYAKRWTP